MSQAVVAPRYMTRFQCIGSACETSCCAGGWAIDVSAAQHRKLRKALSQTKEDRALFEKAVKRLGGSRPDGKYGLLVMNERTNSCHFLSGGMCGVQKRFGAGALPDICMTYPRRQSIVGDRLETAAMLSCPEAARQALLQNDAMELVDVERSIIARDYFVQGVQGEVEDYEAALDLVREAIMNILAGAGSLEAGLGTVAVLAEALGGFGRGKAVDPQKLVATLETFVQPANTAQVARELRSIEVPLGTPVFTILQVLAARKQFSGGEFSEVVEHAAAAYGIGEEAIVGDVAKAFGERRQSLGKLVDPRLNEILVNYALNHTFAQWYTASSDLGTWVRGLFLRVATIRFLVYAHPRIAALATAATESDAKRSVELVAVEVVHRLSRAIEHHPAFLKMLDVALPASMPGLEHALCLLKI